jgi:magnesium chelatase subunit I
MILLGLRGQAKSRILRSLTSLLDEASRSCRAARSTTTRFRRSAGAAATSSRRGATRRPSRGCRRPALRGEARDARRDDRRHHRRRGPDPAARGGFDLASELTMHYGLLPRAHRGIFALNELPDLAGRIQVGLFNILQEGDVQIKGYPVRLPLDVCMVFTANPEDYTARGKIITPLKDRIGSEIRTHYPTTLEHGVAITAQEAWTARRGLSRVRSRYVREVVEGIAFAARRDKKIDRRQRRLAAAADLRPRERGRATPSGGRSSPARRRSCPASPTSTRRCRRSPASSSWSTRASCGRRERGPRAHPRGGGGGVLDLPRLGGLPPGRALLRGGRHLRIREGSSSEEVLGQLQRCRRRSSTWRPSGVRAGGPGAAPRRGGEFVLEGLWAQKKIGRSDDRASWRPERRGDVELDLERLERLPAS